MPRLNMHRSITRERVVAACRRRAESLDNPGFCLSCGFEQEGAEPDAEEITCESCGEESVMGSDEILLRAEMI